MSTLIKKINLLSLILLSLNSSNAFCREAGSYNGLRPNPSSDARFRRGFNKAYTARKDHFDKSKKDEDDDEETVFSLKKAAPSIGIASAVGSIASMLASGSSACSSSTTLQDIETALNVYGLNLTTIKPTYLSLYQQAEREFARIFSPGNSPIDQSDPLRKMGAKANIDNQAKVSALLARFKKGTPAAIPPAELAMLREWLNQMDDRWGLHAPAPVPAAPAAPVAGGAPAPAPAPAPAAPAPVAMTSHNFFAAVTTINNQINGHITHIQNAHTGTGLPDTAVELIAQLKGLQEHMLCLQPLQDTTRIEYQGANDATKTLGRTALLGAATSAVVGSVLAYSKQEAVRLKMYLKDLDADLAKNLETYNKKLSKSDRKEFAKRKGLLKQCKKLEINEEIIEAIKEGKKLPSKVDPSTDWNTLMRYAGLSAVGGAIGAPAISTVAKSLNLGDPSGLVGPVVGMAKKALGLTS